MKLRHVSTQVRDLAAATRFYEDVLQLPVRGGSGEAVVSVGESALTLREEPRSTVCDHLAFDIPPRRLERAASWLRARGVVLLTRDGSDEFEMPPGWNARSVYFEGPSGSILEFIERRDLKEAAPDRFEAPSILRISEVGVATPDVTRDRQRLVGAGLERYGGTSSDDFSPVGDMHGLLILVTAGRAWMPTDHHRSTMAPLDIQIAGHPALDLDIGSARIRGAGSW